MWRVDCWLWDYLGRSGPYGFLVPISSNADSSSTAAIVGSMYHLVIKETANGSKLVKADAFRLGHYADGQFPTVSKEFDKHILNTMFMGSRNSLEATTAQAKVLVDKIIFVGVLMDCSQKGWIEKDQYFFELMEKHYGKREHLPTNEEIYIVLSLVVYAVTFYPLLKYMILMLITDDSGETGTQPSRISAEI